MVKGDLDAGKVTKSHFDEIIGALTDESNIMGSVLGRNRAIFDNVHIHVGMVVADKTDLTANETSIIAALEKKYEVFVIDDDDIDAGNFDLGICELIIVSTSVTDMTKINNLTTVAVPVFTRSAEAALTILRIGDNSGGSGVSWGEAATETAINIVDNTHEITTDQSVGSLTVYSPAGRMQWIRASDVVAGAHELAEISGDSTKSTIVVLPYDVDDEDGNPTLALRVFIGLREFGSFNSSAQNLMFNALDWAVHQWLFSVKVQGLNKVNTVINMIGRNKFASATDLYDYLVTGTTGAAPFEVISEEEIGSVLERLEWIKNGVRRGTGTILPANKSLYDYLLAVEAKLDAWPAERGTDNAELEVDASVRSNNLITYAREILTGVIQGTGTVLPANKSLYDILWVDRHTSETGTFNWDTSEYTTSETEITTLFTSWPTLNKRRKITLYLDMSAAVGDAAAWTNVTVKVKLNIGGTANPRTIDKKVKLKTDLASTAEPGITIDIPPALSNLTVTLQFDVALAADQTIVYEWVCEKMQY